MLTNEQIQKVFHKAVAMCDESGFHADSLVQTVGYHRKKNAFATCYTHRDMFGTCSNIKVSKYYAEKASEQQMLNTLVHEVLHACFPRENHGGKWAKAAAVMNKKYGLDISRCADYKDENGDLNADKRFIEVVLASWLITPIGSIVVSATSLL